MRPSLSQSTFDLIFFSSSPHPYSEGYLHPLGNVHRGDNFELRHLYWGYATQYMKVKRWSNLNWIKWTTTAQAYGLEDLVAEKVFWLPTNVSFLFPVLPFPFLFLFRVFRYVRCSIQILFVPQSKALLGSSDSYGERYSDVYKREARVSTRVILRLWNDKKRALNLHTSPYKSCLGIQDLGPEEDIASWASKATPSSPMAAKILTAAFAPSQSLQAAFNPLLSWSFSWSSLIIFFPVKSLLQTRFLQYCVSVISTNKVS